MSILNALCVFAAVASLAATAEPINPASFSDPVRIACVGDSITQGSGTKGNPYPKQLQELLGDEWKVGNFRITEENLQKLMPMMEAVAKELNVGIIDMYAALAEKPELIPDRVHPNAAGALEMAKAAHAVLTGKPAGEK